MSAMKLTLFALTFGMAGFGGGLLAATDPARVLSGACEGERVCVQGVLASVATDSFDPEFSYVSLNTPAGMLCISVVNAEHPPAGLRRLLDAEVEFCGKAMRFEQWRDNRLPYVCVRSNDAFRVLTPPPAAPFAPTGRVFDVRLHRQPYRGTVLHSGIRRAFATHGRDDVTTIRFSRDETPPPVGHLLTAVGFPGTGRHGLQLSETLFRAEPQPEQPPRTTQILELRPNELFSGGRTIPNIPNEFYHGKRIRIVGRLLRSANALAGRDGLTLDCGSLTFSVDADDLGDDAVRTVESGSTVEMTGLCLFQFAPNDSGLPTREFLGFTLIPTDAAAVRVLSRPPWWTPGRLLAVISSLLALLVGIVIWNRILRHLVDRRSRELLRAQIATVSSELRVEERTRLAVELHDAISQNLSGAAMRVDAVRAFIDSDLDKARTCLDYASRTLVSCREELRNCIWDLRNRALDEKNLNEAIRRTLAPHLGDARLSVRFNVPRARLSENTLHALLRIIRELASNALRHGHAAHLSVAGAIEGEQLLFSVTDDGCGFDPANRLGIAEGHFGLQGIGERVRQMHGGMSIESKTGKGTRVAIWIKSRC